MNAEEYIFTAMGTTGMDETEFHPGQKVQGMPFEFTAVEFKGKLYAETLEGVLTVRAQAAELEILNPVGERLKVLSRRKRTWHDTVHSWMVLFREYSII